MKWFHKKVQKTFDRDRKQPVMHISICTGETAVGFKDKETGKFEEVMLIKEERDLQEFMKMYHIHPEEIKKEW